MGHGSWGTVLVGVWRRHFVTQQRGQLVAAGRVAGLQMNQRTQMREAVTLRKQLHSGGHDVYGSGPARHAAATSRSKTLTAERSDAEPTPRVR